MIKETCLFDETVQFIRNYKHCYSAASYGCDKQYIFTVKLPNNKGRNTVNNTLKETFLL